MGKQRYKRYIRKCQTAILTGVVLSLAAAGTAHGSEVPGPGYVQQAEEPTQSPGYWVQRDGSWYYYNPNGTPANGWIVDKGKHYYLAADGRMLTNAMTPDGYYVDGSGEWYRRTTEILGTEFLAPEKFPALEDSWAGQAAMGRLRLNIGSLFKERRIRMTADAVEYLSGTEKNEKVLLGIYKLPDSDAYRLDIGIGLNARSTKMDQTETYDYMVFCAFLYQLTSVPDILEKAVYSSWEEDNSRNISRTHWSQIGDAWVRYTAGSGYGHYYIYRNDSVPS